MLISLEELPEALRKHVAELRAVVKSALEDFVRDHAKLRYRYTERSEASLIHDYMVHFAKGRFDWRLKRNLFLIKLDEFRAKLKKLDGNWHARSIPTQLVIRFENQKPLRLFDDLDLTSVYLGYQRDEAEITRSRIWLVCPEGKGFRWIAELSAAATATTPVNFAIQVPTTDTATRRIKPKAGIQKSRKGRGKE